MNVIVQRNSFLSLRTEMATWFARAGAERQTPVKPLDRLHGRALFLAGEHGAFDNSYLGSEYNLDPWGRVLCTPSLSGGNNAICMICLERHSSTEEREAYEHEPPPGL